MSETKIYNCCISSDMLETFIALNYVRLATVGRSAIEKGPDVYLSKPGAIDLGKRLLKHFDVLPTKEEVDFIETTLLLRKLAMNSKREVKQCTATIAKLRRLVGEEESDASV